MRVSQFHDACKAADFNALEMMLADEPQVVDALDTKFGWTPLSRAIICSQAEVANFLLKRGANPNCKTAIGEPPLYLAVSKQQDGLARLLLEYGADPSCSNAGGETPLHAATLQGRLDTMELLLSSGASPDQRDSVFHRTPMHIATDCGLDAAVALLYRYNASPFPTKKRSTVVLPGVLPKDLLERIPPGRSKLTQEASEGHKLVRAVSTEQDTASSGLEHISEKIMSVLTANDALPSSASLNASCASVDKPNPNTSNTVSTRFSLSRDTPLSEWLHDLRLDEIYEKLVESGFDDLEEMIEQQRTGISLTPVLLSDIGIEKLGHRLLLLAGLELEAAADTEQEVKTHRGHTLSCMRPVSPRHGMPEVPSLEQWLASLSLEMYKEAFERCGFEHLEQVLALVHTTHGLTEEMLETDLDVKKLGHRHRMLGSIHELASETDPVKLLFTSGRRRSPRATSEDTSCSLM